MANIVDYIQDQIEGILKDGGIPSIKENSLDVVYEVKSALAKQGLACIIAVPTIACQGNNGRNKLAWQADVEIQIFENPVINRAALKKAGKTSGTAMDIALAAADLIAAPGSSVVPRYVVDDITETVQDQHVLVVLKARTVAL